MLLNKLVNIGNYLRIKWYYFWQTMTCLGIWKTCIFYMHHQNFQVSHTSHEHKEIKLWIQIKTNHITAKIFATQYLLKSDFTNNVLKSSKQHTSRSKPCCWPNFTTSSSLMATLVTNLWSQPSNGNTQTRLKRQSIDLMKMITKSKSEWVTTIHRGLGYIYPWAT